MANHSVADAKAHLSELIDLAVEGKSVVITRHGRPVVELRAIARPARPISPADLDWLAARRAGKRGKTDAGELMRRLRDEWER